MKYYLKIFIGLVLLCIFLFYGCVAKSELVNADVVKPISDNVVKEKNTLEPAVDSSVSVLVKPKAEQAVEVNNDAVKAPIINTTSKEKSKAKPGPSSTVVAGKTYPLTKLLEKDVIGYEYYNCPKCNLEYTNTGKCKKCKVDLVKKIKSYSYVCVTCGYSQKKEGKCKICKTDLKKYAVKYHCVPCQVTGNEPGKCTKCGQDYTKIKVPSKK